MCVSSAGVAPRPRRGRPLEEGQKDGRLDVMRSTMRTKSDERITEATAGYKQKAHIRRGVEPLPCASAAAAASAMGRAGFF